MNSLDYLKELYYKNFSINLSSSVFRELTLDYPSIVLWLKDNDLNITSKKDYNAYKYYDSSIIKLYEVSDYEKIILIYRIAAFKYKYDSEEILSNLINIFDEKELKKIDNK